MKYLLLVLVAIALLAATSAAPVDDTTTQASTGCLYKGVEYAAGQTYKQDCNTCHCIGNNLAMCTLMACIDAGTI